MKLLYVAWGLLILWVIDFIIVTKVVKDKNSILEILLNDIGIALASSAFTLSVVSFFYN